MFGFKARHRRRLKARALREDWTAIIQQNVRYYYRLSENRRRDLEGLIQVFLDEKRFEGCGGLDLTDEIRLTVAGFACILLLGGQSDMYPKLRSILIYPDAYWAPNRRQGPAGTISEELQVRSGEAWSFGNVVISWNDVQRDSAADDTGRNVVFHEFAHQLDFESGFAQGAPVLPETAGYYDWARVFGAEYTALIASIDRGEQSLFDPYGATSPAEFFAVATECFFLKPVQMKAQHAELYEQLSLYYRQDPARENRNYIVGP